MSRKASLLSFTVSMMKRTGGCQFRPSKKLSTFEGDVYVAFRDLDFVRLVRRGYYLFFNTLHVWITKNGGNQTPQDCALSVSLLDPLYWKFVIQEAQQSKHMLAPCDPQGWVVLQFLSVARLVHHENTMIFNGLGYRFRHQ